MLRSTFSSLREYLTPVTHTSSFQSTGQLTPEEFVKAGDYLVYKFPTWSWAPASSRAKTRDFLPPDKQFLVTQHVPCATRASGAAADAVELTEGDNDAWLVSSAASASATAAPSDGNASGAVSAAPVDLDELEALGIAEEPEEVGSAPAAPREPHSGSGDDKDNRGQARSYNIYITYSTSYRVPKAYLSGFDADGAPLQPRLMFDDIVGDYKDKTVTIEQAPFADSLTLISIHPCRHAGVMRMLLDMADQRATEVQEEEEQHKQQQQQQQQGDDADDWEEVPQGPRVDQYLIVFLKFIASVTPTIEYDFTMSAL